MCSYSLKDVAHLNKLLFIRDVAEILGFISFFLFIIIIFICKQ